ncbi:MAG TPA: serine/threonine-protein kinase, partial [Pseudomonadota bacterium]|nr:serine/threonine-protein kinase [Pseudomonadota bacterium]
DTGSRVTTEPPIDDEQGEPLLNTLIDGRYRVLSRLGDGGMGIVYRAEHTYLNKEFALKVMRPTRDVVDRQRFEQEARLASRIRHRNVVEISDFGILPTGQPYFVMELLRGETLGEAIYQGRIKPLLACLIAAQVASGLQAVHKQNVVHRDLKPDNIFLLDLDAAAAGEEREESESDPPGQVNFVKIMDFGIAKSIDNKLTGTGMTLGTPEYMSPEQATGEKLDWRSDQYSLGCILYEMLTGELPFAGKTAFEVMNKHLSSPPMPPRQRRPENAAGIPVGLEKIVLSMMQKKPANRFPSMRAVEQALREVAASMQVAEAKVEPASSNKATLVMSPVAEPPLASPPAAAPGRARPAADSSPDDQKTRPLLPAIKPAEEPAASEPASNAARTMLMPPPGNKPGSTPTPRLLERIEYRIKSNSAPDLGRSPFWQRIPWLFAIVRWFKRLFS